MGEDEGMTRSMRELREIALDRMVAWQARNLDRELELLLSDAAGGGA